MNSAVAESQRPWPVAGENQSFCATFRRAANHHSSTPSMLARFPRKDKLSTSIQFICWTTLRAHRGVQILIVTIITLKKGSFKSPWNWQHLALPAGERVASPHQEIRQKHI